MFLLGSCVCISFIMMYGNIREIATYIPESYVYPNFVSQLSELSKRAFSQGGHYKASLSILDSPEKQYNLNSGDSVVLQCSAGGHPSPSVYWTRNHDMLTEELLYGLLNNNALMNQFPITGMSTTEARLYLDCIEPKDAGIFECVAETPYHHMQADTKLIIADDMKTTACVPSKEARIILWTSLYMDLQGKDAILLCRTERNTPVIWKDLSGHKIRSSRKFKVTKTGELVIRNMEWDDMGTYMCETLDGTDSQEAFVYPLSDQSLEKSNF